MSNGYPTSTFLDWLADRLENVYGESPNVDFVQRLRAEAANAKALEEGMDAIEKTYHLERVVDSEYMTGQKGYVFARNEGASSFVIGSEFRLTDQEAHDIGMALALPEHVKHHGVHSH